MDIEYFNKIFYCVILQVVKILGGLSEKPLGIPLDNFRVYVDGVHSATYYTCFDRS